MDLIFLLFIAGIILSVAGWLIWVIFFVWLAKISMRNRENDMINMLIQLENMLRYSQQGGNINLSPQQQSQFAQMMMQAQTKMRQLDDLSRQRYETRMGDLMGMASGAGIDWSPPSY